MEIVRENLNIDVNPFMNALKSIEGITGKAYDSELKKLTLNVFDSWTKEGELDGLISEYNLDNFAFIISPNVTKFDSSELQKKIRKQSLLKNKLISIDYNYKTFALKFKFEKPFDAPEIAALDNIVDNLVGYDVVTQKMGIYNKRRADGWDTYNEQRSIIVLAINNGQLSAEDEDFIQMKIKDVIFYLNNGDWVTAEKRIRKTIAEGAYTQQVKDSFLNTISTYVLENY